jgi:hypothetical protein
MVDYCFAYSYDSSAGDYDPSRKCFTIAIAEQENWGNRAGDVVGCNNPVHW